jgi:hypothetical protein
LKCRLAFRIQEVTRASELEVSVGEKTAAYFAGGGGDVKKTSQILDAASLPGTPMCLTLDLQHSDG